MYTVTSKSISVRWSRVPGIHSVKVTATPKTVPGTPVFVQFNGATIIGSIVSLNPSTIYTVNVEVIDSLGNMLASSEIEQRTAPDVPSIDQAYSKQSSSITVEWTAVPGATGYTLRAKDGKSIIETTVTDSPGTIRNLDPATQYMISLMSVNAGGRSQPSLPKKAKTGLTITEISSPSATELEVKWTPGSGVNYFLDLRVVNSTNIAPIVLFLPESPTVRLVGGLRPATVYNVTVKSSILFYVVESTWKLATTVPGTSQIIEADAISSTAIRAQWSVVTGAQRYYLIVKSDSENYNLTFSTLQGTINNLQPTKTYMLNIYTANAGGLGAPSKIKTVTTLVPPPTGATLSNIGSNAVRIDWQPVDKVLLYGIFVYKNENLSSTPEILKTTDTFVVTNSLMTCTNYVFGLRSANNFMIFGEESYITYKTGIPCAPINLDIYRDCYSNVVFFYWDPTPNTDFYSATALGSDGAVMECRTTDTSCFFTDLNCGMGYMFRVSSVKGECSSANSAPVRARIAPCAPVVNEAFLECSASLVLVMWNQSPGAESYTATLQSNDGSNLTCNTTFTSCIIPDLKCGVHYMVTVNSHDGTCASPESESIQMTSVPCIPENIKTHTDCETGIVKVLWDPSAGAEMHSAIVEAEDGIWKYCSSTGTSCDIGGLQCGQSYTVLVMSSNGTCYSEPSQREIVQEVPCAPSNVNGDLACETNTVHVSWNRSSTATSYTATVTGRNHFTKSCSTGNLTCSVDSLQCGEQYTITVLAENGECSSLQSASASIKTAPCDPQNIVARLDCITSIAIVYWDPSPGAESYTVMADGSNDHVISCNTPNTTCQLNELDCGQLYNVTVLAQDSKCSSTPINSASVQTAPCPPQNVNANLNCASNNASVSWSASQGAVSYRVTAVREDGQSEAACSTQSNNCDVSNLQCGLKYDITVTPLGQKCTGFQSAAFQLTSRPCPPTNVSTTLDCRTNIGSVSWKHELGAELFIATATENDGHTHTCNTSDSTCQFTDLHCGNTYTVTVVAVEGDCNSSDSVGHEIKTVPCAPINLDIYRDCYSNVVFFYWDPTPNTDFYSATALGSDGAVMECRTTDTSCFFTDLNCGMGYMFRVSSVKGECSSANSAPARARTAPCEPTNMKTIADCQSDVLTSSWDTAAGALSYTVEAKGNTGKWYNCSSFSNSCSMPGVPCGESLSVWIIASDDQCTSAQALGEVAETVPCTPTNVTADAGCSTDSLSVSWSYSSGALMYFATAEGSDGTQHACVARDTHCQITALECGQSYTVYVTATNLKCNSSRSSTVTVKTAPCAPEVTEAFLECSTSLVLVMWNQSPGAESYTATLQSNDGSNLTCNTTFTSCIIPDLKCGVHYMVTVNSHDGTCASPESESIQMTSVPCIPENIKTHTDCETGIVKVLWDPSAGAEMHSAIVEAEDGIWKYCSSTGTSCDIGGLQCGQSYTVLVMSSNGTCYSEPSQREIVQEVPCAPSNVNGDLACETNTVHVSWNRSSTATSYTATVTGRNHFTKSCSTGNLTCSVDSLQCGEQYTITVLAENGECSSLQSASASIKTAPCDPQNIVARLDCITSIAIVYWDPSPGAESYTVMADGSNDHVISCNTPNTTCQLNELDCGQLYNVTVLAQDSKCSSTPINSASVQTAPCPPQNVNANLNCASNNASVSWSASQGAVSYRVTAVREDGQSEAACSTQSNNCDVSNLQCGLKYDITVTPLGQKCTGFQSAAFQLTSRPCPPTNVSTTLDCRTNIGSVSWKHELGAELFIATATENDGHTHTCNTSDSTCQFTDLHCGNTYTVTVVAVEGDCNSSDSVGHEIKTAPCPPQNVNANLNCASNNASVSWSASQGAVSYRVTAVREDGQSEAACSTQSNNCDVSNLQCGLKYDITVTPLGQKCTGFQSAAFQLTSRPCPPTNVSTTLDCRTNIGSVSWKHELGAELFIATATENDGHTHTCNTSDSTCQFTDLHCGNTYTVTVVAVEGDCNSSDSVGHEIKTAPCPPQNVNANLNCASNNASVSWSASQGAVSYRVTAVREDGQSEAACSTQSNNCDVSNLQCGLKYDITVTPLGQKCTGFQSAAFQLTSRPCPPTNVSTTLDCRTNIGSVSWKHELGAELFIATATENDGHTHTCNTSDSTCQFTDLHCGNTYTVTVVAVEGDCNSSDSVGHEIKTAPCAPTITEGRVGCESNTASVSWVPINKAVSYTLTASGANGHQLSCSGTNTSCNLNGMQCGQTYTAYATAQGSQCESAKSAGYNIVAGTTCNITSLLCGQKYTVTVTGLDNNCNSVRSNSTEIETDGMTCGTIYSFTVTASNGVCNSSFSVPVIAGAVPCPPESVALSLLLLVDAVQEAKVGWSAVQCVGVEYSVEMHGLIEDDPQAQFILTSYWTRATHFFIPVPCSSTYNVTVTSRTSAGIGYPSPPVQGLAVPCPPKGVTFYTEGTSQVISWHASVHAMEYVVYSSKAQRTELCRTSHFSCTVPKKQNDTIEVTAVNSAGESEPSVEILVQDTNLKRRRRDLTEDTGTYEDYTSPIPTLAQL
ncbi:UNVERIFIED_CONTAM: hypothetical protein FKN15_073877 [Acipenser sinensis]